MDQGAIWSLKVHHNTISITKMIEAIEKKKPLTEFSIFDAMQWLDVAWWKVRTKTAVKCFEQAAVSKQKQSEALQDDDHPFKDLQEQLDQLAVYNSKFFLKETTANDNASVDDSQCWSLSH